MDRVITYSFGEDFIGNLASYIEENYMKRGRDITRLALVFGGTRPALFLKKELSRRMKRGYMPPKFFSMDEFVDYVLFGRETRARITDLEACYAIYKLAKKEAPGVLKGREGFARFLPWAREISSFIEEVDLEDIDAASIKGIELGASIGYEAPASVNTLLGKIISLREAYHGALEEGKAYPRGYSYLLASRRIGGADLGEFDEIFFCNFFYLHKTEAKIIKGVYDKGKALLFFQGDEDDWPVLKDVSRMLGCRIKPERARKTEFKLNIMAGFDAHSQAGLAREALKTVKMPDKSVIVLPDPDRVITLLPEIAPYAGEFNVSMGYPLKRSSLYSVFEGIFKAQETRKGGACLAGRQAYYAKDYLNAMRHPLVKNLKILAEPAATRMLVHDAEEMLLGIKKSPPDPRRTPLGGSVFVNLEDVSAAFEGAQKEIIGELHGLLFHSWENIRNFDDFAAALERLLDFLVEKSFLGSYPLNLKIVEKMILIKDELRRASFCREPFSKEEMFKIFLNDLESEKVSFSGSPLKGLQILGLLETRSLNFEEVIVMDLNEGALPRLRIYEPLIPREVMVRLGINRLEKEEQIQRYQFMRLISCAKKVHLIYEKSEEKEKSRFLEELIWERQKASGRLDAVPVSQGSFRVEVLPGKIEARKNAEVMKALGELVFSPSSVDTYVRCPLSFYYEHVLCLKEKRNLLEDPDASEIGTFVHKLLEDEFKRFEGKKPRIDDKFKAGFMNALDDKFDRDLKNRMRSDSFLVREVLRARLSWFLENEERQKGGERKVARLLKVEWKGERLPLDIGGKAFKFTCKVDRIDGLEDGSVLITDYKTGGEDVKPQGVKSLESMALSREEIKRKVKSFQLPLYIWLVGKHFPLGEYKDAPMNAALYNLRDTKISALFKPEEISGAKEATGAFMRPLEFIMDEIRNPDVPFAADSGNARHCKNCPYFYLCR